MNEAALLELICARSSGLSGRGVVVVGPGDDCAVLAPQSDAPSPALMLATVDQLVEGRHYDPATVTLQQIARKSVARSVSDIAAMGGAPGFALAAGCLRDGFAGADELFAHMHEQAARLGCPLVGGDIAFSNGPTVLSVTVLGSAHPVRGPVLRSTAGVGDSVCVTGRIGGSLASGRHLDFSPRLRQGTMLCDSLGPALTAMIDISDGLGRDAGRIGRASGVVIALEAARIPLHADAGGWLAALSQGEDYELLFTVAAGAEPPTDLDGVPVTVIGRAGAAKHGAGCTVIDPGGNRLSADEMGWDHGETGAANA